MRAQRITVDFAADPDGTLSLPAFLSELDRLRSALYYTARDPDDPDAVLRVRVRIVDLSRQKTFKVVADAAVSNGHVLPTHVGKTLVANLSRLKSARISAGPPIRDMDVLQAYQRLGEPVQRQTTRQVTIASGGSRIAINKQYVDRLAKVIGPDKRERGSVSGRLLKVNLYRTHRFDIFPSVGPHRIACSFRKEQEKEVISVVGQYVTVEGTLRFKFWDDLPYAIDAKSIHPHDQAMLPTLAELRGLVSPSALGGMTSEEFVDSSREEDW
jgi:hypothetical protein